MFISQREIAIGISIYVHDCAVISTFQKDAALGSFNNNLVCLDETPVKKKTLLEKHYPEKKNVGFNSCHTYETVMLESNSKNKHFISWWKNAKKNLRKSSILQKIKIQKYTLILKNTQQI